MSAAGVVAQLLSEKADLEWNLELLRAERVGTVRDALHRQRLLRWLRARLVTVERELARAPALAIAR